MICVSDFQNLKQKVYIFSKENGLEYLKITSCFSSQIRSIWLFCYLQPPSSCTSFNILFPCRLLRITIVPHLTSPILLAPQPPNLACHSIFVAFSRFWTFSQNSQVFRNKKYFSLHHPCSTSFLWQNSRISLPRPDCLFHGICVTLLPLLQNT